MLFLNNDFFGFVHACALQGDKITTAAQRFGINRYPVQQLISGSQLIALQDLTAHIADAVM
jgi:hypothetical protein